MTTEAHQENKTAPNAPEARIVEAARALFFAKGFSAVSTDRLARAASVSKSSIYKYFGDMAGVFAAVVRDEGDIFELGFDTLPGTRAAFWTAVIGFGDRLLALLNRGFCIQLDRMLHEEARNQPDLMATYYNLAHGRSHTELGKVFAHGKAMGFITKPQPAADLADNLLSMWVGLAVHRCRLRLVERPFDDPGAWSRQCVLTLFERDTEGV